MPAGPRRALAWVWVALCALAVFLTVPVARVVQAFAFRHAGPNVFSILLLALVAGAFAAAAIVLLIKFRLRRPARYAWLAVCAAAYAGLTVKYWSGAVEAAHFIEYGLLGALLFRAWRLSLPDRGAYPAAFFTGTLAGTTDEIIQWAVPGRYFDFPDIGLNALGVGLVLIAIRQGLRPAGEERPMGPRSVRRVSILAAANLVLLGLCLSNTPERTAALAARFPFLAALEKEEPMREHVSRHSDPRIGVFSSRLTAEWLKKTDLAQARENGQILKDWQDKDYGRFLANFNQVWTPFLYEMRVRLFRRDRYEAAGDAAEDARARREAWLVAAKENLILETYFGRTLAESGYAWPAEKRRAIHEAVDLSRPYKSPVGRGILPGFDEKALWILIAVLLAGLTVWNLRAGQAKVPGSSTGRP
ncbi:MAG: VanZ family protein [Candidatus Aminicenantes bacterium]|nr:VanZ family protein [Candidatus Aminicenantes bacterium]